MLEKLINLFERDDWKTIKGSHVLLGKDGKIKAGAGGKFNGVKFDHSSPAKKETKPSSEPVSKEKKSSDPHDHTKAKMDKSQIDAFKNYSGTAYLSINKNLRNSKNLSKSDQKDVDKMDEVFKNASTKEDVTVYRGMSGNMVHQLTVGSTFEDRGFVSTSTNKKYSQGFMNFGDDSDAKAFLEIKIPKGSRAVSLTDVSQFGKSEQEILIDRGYKFKVTGVKKQTRTRPHTITIELIKS